MGMRGVLCAVEGCNQRASLQSGDDLLCGDHWKIQLEYLVGEEEKDELLRLAARVEDEDASEVLRRLIERSFN
jgi:hypothetical protein